MGTFVVPGSAASLTGTSVTGSLTFPGDPSNYFDPGYQYAPGADLNALFGTTVTISDTAVEFGFDDTVANALSADFAGNTLTITDVVEGTVTNNALEMQFTDVAFANESLVPTSQTDSLIGGYSIAGEVLTINSSGGNVVAGQTFTDTFLLEAVPEASTLNLTATVGFLLVLWRVAHKTRAVK